MNLITRTEWSLLPSGLSWSIKSTMPLSFVITRSSILDLVDSLMTIARVGNVTC